MNPIEVSKEINAPLEQVFDHFVSPSERERLDLHHDHVKAYRETGRWKNGLAYEFVFQSYGFRFWGTAREHFVPHSYTLIEIDKGVMAGGRVELFFEPCESGKTRVRQVTHIPEKAQGTIARFLGARMASRITALTGVHLDQHARDLEGRPRREYRTAGEQRVARVVDFARALRLQSLPMIVMPLLLGAGLAHFGGVADFTGWKLALTLLGGAAALLAGNLANDIWDFEGGADHAALSDEQSRLTGSDALVLGSFSPGQAWGIVAVLVATATACGAALTLTGAPWAPAFALAGLLLALLYQAPPLRLSYRGRGLGELCIFAAFGPVPVVAAYYVVGGSPAEPAAWTLGGVAGLGAALVLYCHHFLQWRSDREAGKMGPVATMGPVAAARAGIVLLGAFAAALAAAPLVIPDGPPAMAVSAVAVLILAEPMTHIARAPSDEEARISMRLLNAAGLAFTAGLGALCGFLFAG